MSPAEAAVADYLEGVAADAADAADRPRALAPAILARAVRLGPAAGDRVAYVEAEVGRVGGAETAPDAAAEVVYEMGSILVELRDRFPETPGPLRAPGSLGSLGSLDSPGSPGLPGSPGPPGG